MIGALAFCFRMSTSVARMPLSCTRRSCKLKASCQSAIVASSSNWARRNLPSALISNFPRMIVAPGFWVQGEHLCARRLRLVVAGEHGALGLIVHLGLEGVAVLEG